MGSPCACDFSSETTDDPVSECAYHKELRERAKQAEAERDHLQLIFDLRWKASERAAKRWRAANPSNEFVIPDHADLVEWMASKLALMQEREKSYKRQLEIIYWEKIDLRKQLARLREGLADLQGRLRQHPMTQAMYVEVDRLLKP